MRILYISNSTAVSGAPAALLNIVSGLCGRHQIAVVLPDNKGPLYKALSDLGVKCYCDMPYSLTIWPRVLNPVKLIKRFYALTVGLDKARTYVGQVMDEFCPDIVHTNVGPLDIALTQCRMRGIPHVWHLREFQAGMRFWPSRSTFLGRIHSCANRNIAITDCVFDFWTLRNCDKVIYDGVNLKKPISLDQNFKREDFLFVGRIERNKGLLGLLKAYYIYRKEGGQQRLKVVGRPSMLYALQCRLYVLFRGLTRYVEFLGQRNDVNELMSRSLALVVPSLTEGFGLASVEAMNSDCLVIGNDVTGMKEQFDIGLDYTGGEIGVRYSGIEALAIALNDVSDNPDAFKPMRERAALTVLHKYSMDERLSDLEDYYHEIMEERI